MREIGSMPLTKPIDTNHNQSKYPMHFQLKRQWRAKFKHGCPWLEAKWTQMGHVCN